MMKNMASYFNVDASYLFDEDNDSFPYAISAIHNEGKRIIYQLKESQY
jgi:hypothetical protein